jgi:cell division protein FtsQ
MFRKILIYIGYSIITIALVVYFYLSSQLVTAEIRQLSCNTIEVIILDSARNRFVSRNEIKGLLNEEGVKIGQSKLSEINQHHLEQVINNRTAVKVSHVSYTRSGNLRVQITQRRPIIRIETLNGGFYMDDSAYIFPLIRSFTSYVPVVTGELALSIPPGYRGEGDLGDKRISGLYNMALFLDQNQEWNAMIEQIYVDSYGIFHMTPRAGKTEIIFGTPENIDYKFKKLDSFYKKVIPAMGWEAYSTVDLSFSNQLVCKKTEKRQENKQIKT